MLQGGPPASGAAGGPTPPRAGPAPAGPEATASPLRFPLLKRPGLFFCDGKPGAHRTTLRTTLPPGHPPASPRLGACPDPTVTLGESLSLSGPCHLQGRPRLPRVPAVRTPVTSALGDLSQAHIRVSNHPGHTYDLSALQDPSPWAEGDSPDQSPGHRVPLCGEGWEPGNPCLSVPEALPARLGPWVRGGPHPALGKVRAEGLCPPPGWEAGVAAAPVLRERP